MTMCLLGDSGSKYAAIPLKRYGEQSMDSKLQLDIL